jgi:hypothetical protein
MKRMLIGLALLGLVAGAACTAAQAEPPAAPEPETVTVTAAPEPETVTVTASPSVDPDVNDIAEESEDSAAIPETETVLGSNGDAKACELLRLATTREANSPSWIDIMSDASYEATDYDLMDSIDKAYYTSGDQLAAERVDDTLLICDRLGV